VREGVRSRRRVAPRRLERPSPVAADQADPAHQPRHALEAAARARCGELGPDARHPVRPSTGAMDRRHLRGHALIGERPRRWPPRAPSVVAAGGDAQGATQRADGMIGLLSLHELVGRHRIESVSLAKKAAAFFRISRSSLRMRTSRSSVVAPSLIQVVDSAT